MYKRNTLRLIYLLWNLTFVAAAWVLAYTLRFNSIFPIEKGVPSLTEYGKLIPFILISWTLSFLALKPLQSKFYRIITFDEILWLFRVCFLSTLIFICISYFYNEYRYSRLTLILFFSLHFIFSVLITSFLNFFFNHYRKNFPPRKILAIGSGENLLFYLKGLLESKTIPSRIMGIVLVDNGVENNPLQESLKKMGIPLLQDPENWTQFLSENPCEEVVISLPQKSSLKLPHYLNQLVNQISDIKVIPDTLALTKYDCGIEYVGKYPCLSIHKSPLESHGALVKRACDLIGSLVACVLFFLPSLVIILLIKLSSKGPIIFKQERIGLDGRPFQMLKFRTMKVSTQSESDKNWTTKEDSRCTGVGKILRRTSLDELPQIFNVLMGQMSLVGPRPERPHFVNQFRQHIPKYMLRHQVKSGITGWAQINGYRGDTDIAKRIELDLHYIQNWSFTFDLKILIKTLYKGFYNSNAY